MKPIIVKIVSLSLILLSVVCCGFGILMAIAPALIEVEMANGEIATPGYGLLAGMLFLIPTVVLALAGGGVWIAFRPDRRTEQLLATNIAQLQDVALQLYFDQITELLREDQLHTAEAMQRVHTIARKHTLTLLSVLDGPRKRTLIQFLYDSHLIIGETVIDLNGADLRGIDLSGAHLRGINLSGADLRGVNFQHTDLQNANLQRASITPGQLQAVASLTGAVMPDGTEYS
jgi:hypothetical protein